MMLYGRAAECAALARLLDEARASHSGVLVLRGEPGLGKSALLEEAMERAIGFRVLRAVGVESEAQLAFAGLHQLLRPAFHLIDRLPDPQAAPLSGAFGLSAGGTDNRLALALAVLSLLFEAGEGGPGWGGGGGGAGRGRCCVSSTTRSGWTGLRRTRCGSARGAWGRRAWRC